MTLTNKDLTYQRLETQEAIRLIQCGFDQSGFSATFFFEKLASNSAPVPVNLLKPLPEAYDDCHMREWFPDQYWSLASFCSPKRRQEWIKNMGCFFVDLDFYRTMEGDFQTVVQKILDENPWLPPPTITVDSGRGAYLIWTFNAPMSNKLHQDWKATTKGLVERLAKYGADKAATDRGRVLRTPNSINSKTGRQVVYYRTGPVTSFHEFSWAIKDEIETTDKPVLRLVKTASQTAYKPRQRKKRNTHISDAIKENHMNQKVCDDLERLVQSRGGRLDDARERMAFAYATQCYLLASPDRAVEKWQGFVRRSFKDPEKYTNPERVITAHSKAVEDYELPKIENGRRRTLRYTPSTKYLIDLLEITPDEQQSMTILIGKDEKKRRREIRDRANGVIARQEYRRQAKQDREDALRLRGQGYTIREIGKELGYSKSKAGRAVKGVRRPLNVRQRMKIQKELGTAHKPINHGACIDFLKALKGSLRGQFSDSTNTVQNERLLPDNNRQKRLSEDIQPDIQQRISSQKQR